MKQTSANSKTFTRTLSTGIHNKEPVPTRVINPNASEATCRPKQRSYRNVLKPLLERIGPKRTGPKLFWAETTRNRTTQLATTSESRETMLEKKLTH